jgi:site-specific recombinase XerD
MHALRHFYASVLIDAGESVKAVAEYLGHAECRLNGCPDRAGQTAI